MAIIIKGSTKRGQSLYARGCYIEGFNLYDVYTNWSNAKETAWRWCFEKYMNTPNHCEFHICSHNTMQFSVSWRGEFGGDPAMFIETASNSYIVLLNK